MARPRRVPGVRRALHAPSGDRAASHQGDRGRHQLGPGDDARGAGAHRHGEGRGVQGGLRGDLPTVAARCWWCTATTTASSPTPTARAGRAAGGGLVTLEGGGHPPSLGDPVRCNLLVREFVDSLVGRPSRRGHGRRARAAAAGRCTSPRRSGWATPGATSRSPTSCGALQPDLEIDWLAQHPVTALLAERGERVHPASRCLANESAHIESEAGEHDLHVFQAYGGWTRSWSPTSWSSTTSSPTSRSTWSSPTRAGTSTTSCTRTPSSSAALSRG